MFGTAQCAYAAWRCLRQHARYWLENTSCSKTHIFSFCWHKIQRKTSLKTLNLSKKLCRFRIFPIWIYDIAILSYYFKIVKLFVYKLRFIYLSMNKIIIMQSFISAKYQCKHRIFFYLLIFQFCFYELICASYNARKLTRSCFDFVAF